MSEMTTVRRRSAGQVQNRERDRQLFLHHWGIGFAVGLLCYAFLFINQLTNHYDGIWSSAFYMPGIWELSLGRWMLQLLSVLRAGYAGDPANSLLTIAAIALANTLAFSLFSALHRRKSHLYAAMIMCSVTVCAFLSYRFTSPMFGFSNLLAVLSVYVLNKSRNPVSGFFASVVCVCFSLAIYQSAVGCACFLILLWGMKACVDGEQSIKSILANLLKSGLAVALGCIVYYVIWKSIMKIDGTAASSYKGAENVSVFHILTNLPESIVNAYREFVRFFFYPELRQSVFQTKLLGYMLCAVPIVGLAFCVLGVMRRNILRGLILASYILLIPAAVNFCLLMIPGNTMEIQMTAPLCSFSMETPIRLRST